MSESLLERQDALQQDARKVLEELDLLKRLKSLGKPEIVGSMKTGLMVWEDIDIDVLSSKAPQFNKVLAIASSLEIIPGVKDLLVINNRVYKRRYPLERWHLQTNNVLEFTTFREFVPAWPDGIYLRIRYQSRENLSWQIDCWCIRQTAKSTMDEWIRTRLTPEKREQILELKDRYRQYIQKDRTSHSVDIYRAVLSGS